LLRLDAEKKLEAAQIQVENSKALEAAQIQGLEEELLWTKGMLQKVEQELEQAKEMIDNLQKTGSATTSRTAPDLGSNPSGLAGGGGGGLLAGLGSVTLKKTAPPPEKKVASAPAAYATEPPSPLPTSEPMSETSSSSSSIFSRADGDGPTLEEIQAMTPADIEALLESHAQLERQNRILMRQLEKAGITIAEDIPYDFAKQKMTELSQAMMALLESGEDLETGENAKKMFEYEQQLDRFSQALLNSDEYGEEQKAKEDAWLEDGKKINQEILKQIRRCMPVNVKHLGAEALEKLVTPNGKTLSKGLINRFKKCTILTLLRTEPVKIIKSHPSDLENLQTFGYKLYERRAVFEVLRPIAEEHWMGKKDPNSERRMQFYQTQMEGLKNAEAKESNRGIPAEYAEDLGFPEYEEYLFSGPILSAADNKAYSPSQMLGKSASSRGGGFEHFKQAEQKESRMSGSGSNLLGNSNSKSMFSFSNIDESSTGDQKNRVAALEAKMAQKDAVPEKVDRKQRVCDIVPDLPIYMYICLSRT
jgi:hypothetical protein